ncbi:sugar phosphate nucleotidyltransferase [Sulfitobacter sp. F26204]|uniref:sugar phosphate nucleotidyltransferase n=1 Tax=Sulfitobacter sp. F26204 TaxID=2996014 RepID=UPI00225E3836|nr:sugar phosphate nucleotidyltransferase [Sulfitobacter sp. F26204]MCX7560512.1 sugar phosphate nucleotidyltransferase [Sulfitobacter sp. F26204]
MLSMIQKISSSLVVVRLTDGALDAGTFATLQPICSSLQDNGCAAVLIDLSKLSRWNHGGLAGVVELYTCFGAELSLGFCGLDAKARACLASNGIAQALPLFDRVEQALEVEVFRRQHLTGLKALILSAGKGSRMAPLSDAVPKPMLEVLGRPVLAHLAAHLGRCGLHDLIVNPGHLGYQIPEYFQRNQNSQRFLFVNEGCWNDGAWQANPLGSASTLTQLNANHSAFGDDTVVMCGDALTDIDFVAMLKKHRESSAGVTIAVQEVDKSQVNQYGIIVANRGGQITAFQEKPSLGEARSTLASTGIYIFRADVLRALRGPEWEVEGLDIGNDLLPTLLRDGIRLQVFNAPFQWADMGNPQAYYAAVSDALRGLGPAVTATGVQKRPGLWIGSGARVSPRAQITGPCHIGEGAVIEAGARIDGPCMIGAGAQIAGKTLIRNSIIWADTRVEQGGLVDHMIVSGDWAVDHRFATGGAVEKGVLGQVGPVAADLPAVAALTPSTRRHEA